MIEKLNWNNVKVDTSVYVVDKNGNHIARHFAGMHWAFGLPTVWKDGKTSHTTNDIEYINSCEFNTPDIREVAITNDWLQKGYREEIAEHINADNSYIKADCNEADSTELIIWNSIYLK